MENKHTVYFNMCHHYRKILHAKPCVDTSPPKILQMKVNNQWRFNRPTSAFHQKILNQENVKQLQAQDSIRPNRGPVICQYYYQHHCKDELKHVDKSFAVPQKPFNPTILKSNVQSKLRSLRVYHPPRKKKVVLKVSEKSEAPQANGDDQQNTILSNTIFETTERKNPKRSSFSTMENSYSEESSEDSAYNEGECILSSDSRGSTPQNSSNKLQSLKKLPISDTKLLKSIPSTSQTLNYKSSDDVICIQFLKDITNDILKKNIFTNKALRSVFQHHVKINKYGLHTGKMLSEIAKLQERLGVPKDDKFDDEDYGLGGDVTSDDTKNETDATYLDEGITSYSASPASAIIQEGESHATCQMSDENHEQDEENEYSDSFSDDNSYASPSDREKREESNQTNNDDDDVASVITNEEVHEIDEESENNTDVESNVQQVASSCDTESDLEVSEAC